MLPPAFHLRLGGVLWPVFLFCNKYDAEVMFCLWYGYGMDIFKQYKYTCYFIQLCKGI